MNLFANIIIEYSYRKILQLESNFSEEYKSKDISKYVGTLEVSLNIVTILWDLIEEKKSEDNPAE